MLSKGVHLAALVFAARAQMPPGSRVCPGFLSLYECLGCTCSQGEQIRINADCTNYQLPTKGTNYGFLIGAEGGRVAACTASTAEACNQMIQSVRHGVVPTYNTSQTCVGLGGSGDQGIIHTGQCVNVGTSPARSTTVSVSCPPPPPPPTPGTQCIDNNQAFVQAVSQACAGSPSDGPCSIIGDDDTCDEFVTDITEAGQTCSSPGFQTFSRFCCSSCKSGGHSPDNLHCQIYGLTCSTDLAQIALQCCPALQLPYNPTDFTNRTLATQCTACAQRVMGANYPKCTCCLPPLISRQMEQNGVPRAWFESVFGTCTNQQ